MHLHTHELSSSFREDLTNRTVQLGDHYVCFYGQLLPADLRRFVSHAKCYRSIATGYLLHELENIFGGPGAAKQVLLSDADHAAASAHSKIFDGRNPPSWSPYVSEHLFVGSRQLQERAAYAEDLLRIHCSNVTFSYPSDDGNSRAPVLKSASFVLEQGHLITVTGDRGCGKATLLQIIGGPLTLSGDSHGLGKLFIPPHLRVLHVTYLPEFVSGKGILENLCFGPSDGVDEDPKRVLAICSRLGLSAELLKVLEAEAHAAIEGSSLNAEEASLVKKSLELTAKNGSLMSHTDRCLLHLARALVMNPEVLVLHKPLTHFDRFHAKRVLQLLREFVDLRGIEKPAVGRRLRRPRTCIYSASAAEGTDLADTVLQITDGLITCADSENLNRLQTRCTKVFSMLDEDGDSQMSLEEFQKYAPQVPWLMKLLGISQQQSKCTSEELDHLLAPIFADAATNCNQFLDVDEFTHFLQRRLCTTLHASGMSLPEFLADEEQAESMQKFEGSKAEAEAHAIPNLQVPKAPELPILEAPKAPEIQISSTFPNGGQLGISATSPESYVCGCYTVPQMSSTFLDSGQLGNSVISPERYLVDL